VISYITYSKHCSYLSTRARSFASETTR